jgi:hypothetical protein
MQRRSYCGGPDPRPDFFILSRVGLRINPKALIRLGKCYCLMYFFILLFGTAMAATA